MGSWTWTSIAAYSLWWGIALGGLAAVLLRVRHQGHRGIAPLGEISLAVSFNALVVVLSGAWVLPSMIATDRIGPEVPWLLSLPFFPYGLAGFAFIRSRVEAKRNHLARAVAVYAFSSAGHLTGLVLLLGFLLARAKVLGPE